MAKKHNSVFNYTSTCCSAPADKPPCAIEKGQRVKAYLGAKPEGDSSLGSFRCTQCRKPCKVTRSLNKTEKAQAAAA